MDSKDPRFPRCGSCPCWEHDSRLKPSNLPNGTIPPRIGICYGKPPDMVVIPIPVMEPVTRVLPLKEPRTQLMSIPGPVRPYTDATDRGCFLHPGWGYDELE